MRHPDLDYWLIERRHQEDIAAAARYRLARQAAKAGAPPRIRLFLSLASLLSFLGHRLLEWSCQLETHYQVLTVREAQRPPSPCA